MARSFWIKMLYPKLGDSAELGTIKGLKKAPEKGGKLRGIRLIKGVIGVHKENFLVVFKCQYPGCRLSFG
jgi:hypothetical protein